jgi:hypothetical protein
VAATFHPIVIFCYQRSDLLKRRIEELTRSGSGEKILISIDGLRVGASFLEAERRMAVIRVAEQGAKSNVNISVKVWQKNFGATDHARRIFEWQFNENVGLICLEEDTSVNFEGLDFLTCSLDDVTLAATAFSWTKHDSSWQSSFRNTLFPAQWGFSIGEPVGEMFSKLLRDRKVNFRVIDNHLKNTYSAHLNSSELKRLSLYWTNHFTRCLRSENFGDAVIQAAVWTLGSYFKAPRVPFTIDDAPLNDPRSLTPRSSQTQIVNCTGTETKLAQGPWCLDCEIKWSCLSHINPKVLMSSTMKRYSGLLT